jgi:hypothetical protein
MKKITILMVTLLLTINAFTQDKYDNRFYFRFGYSNPSWEQFGADKDFWAEGVKRVGATGEIGTIFMLNAIPMPNKTVLGIDVNYLSGYWNQFSHDKLGYTTDLMTLRADSKIGPSFTYNPVAKLNFDIYVKATISWVTSSVFVYDDDNEDADVFLGTTTFGISTGMNVRYSILMLGIEFNNIKPELENVDKDGEFIGDLQNEGKEKSPLPSLNFTLGLNF